MFRSLGNMANIIMPLMRYGNVKNTLGPLANFQRTHVSIQRKLRINDTHFIDRHKKRPDKIMRAPYRKGIVVKLVKMRPKKPNSGNRRCVVVRLSDNKLIKAYIPGENGQVQEHGMVMVYRRPKQDVPGLKYRVMRNKLDMK